MTNWFQIIGEILSAYNTLEYNLRSFLDHAVELTNPQDLFKIHPDLPRVQAEMDVAGIFSFAGDKGVLGALPKVWYQLYPGEEVELSALINQVSSLHSLRNLWVHSTYHQSEDTITLLNYAEYHLNKWGSAGFEHKGRTLTTKPTTKFTAAEAKDYIKKLEEADAHVNEFFTRRRPR